MSKSEEKTKKREKRSRKSTEEEVDVERPKKSRKHDKLPESQSNGSTGALAAQNQGFDPALASLFAQSSGASKPHATSNSPADARPSSKRSRKSNADDDRIVDDGQVDEDVEVGGDGEDAPAPKTRKRKRKDENEGLEESYMQRLDDEERKSIAKAKLEQQQTNGNEVQALDGQEEDASDVVEEDSDAIDGEDAEEDLSSPPPQHESLAPGSDTELARSQRTVFLSNVSTAAIKSKSARKTLMAHLSSFFPSLTKATGDQTTPSVESIRFRSTAYASAIPRKAAFAKKELMDATTQSTNAYAVYSSQTLAREAASRLNGTVVLDRHLRVDEVAHPAKVDHRRCVFVGNLGFVDDESNIDEANAAEGREKRKGKKERSDVEEGLWRTFGKCGKVESVRVIRDSKTRVGKGIAYVQFTDENGVEAALQYNDKRFPPMLPRKLRVMRAKSVKRNAKPNASSTRAPQHSKTNPGYVPKVTSEQKSQLGRAGKMLGRAAAAQMRNPPKRSPGTGANSTSVQSSTSGVRPPETFVFEGHRASARTGKSGLKLSGSGSKKKAGGKPTSRSSKRGTAWKASGKNKKA